MGQCDFIRAWVGTCNNPTVEGDAKCPDHSGKTCVECGHPAETECDNAGSLVCGAPLCGQCTHLAHYRSTDRWYENHVKGLRERYRKDVLIAQEIRDRDREWLEEAQKRNRQDKIK